MPALSTTRFTNRVADYVRYRPDYPPDVLNYLREVTGLSSGWLVADVGSGTGIFTRHLLAAGCEVFAVEPNTSMRAAAEAVLSSHAGFHSIEGSAADTTLQAHTMDLIVCAQAFHWFNTPDTKAEFRRIAKTNAWVALMWNNRITDADDFSAAYEDLLQRLSKDYQEVNHQNLGADDFSAFFRDGVYERKAFANEQVFDEKGLAGRAFSSSYVPSADTDAGRKFAASLQDVFRQHQVDGGVCFRYETEVYLGRI